MNQYIAMLQRVLSGVALFLSFSAAFAEPSRLAVGEFSKAMLEGWEQRDFVGQTEYLPGQIEGVNALLGKSDESASMFYREMQVDLKKTPVLNWSWRIDGRFDPGDETAKAGDDFVARVYVVKKKGLFGLSSVAINYVWSFRHSSGEHWENPFAGNNAIMLAQRDASDPTRRWFHEKRDIAEDFRQLHGIDLDEIDGIAIMTDSDNSQQQAQAWYGDIFFSAD